MKIGFIGLGIMGSRMAANLQKHGNSLAVFNRTRSKAERLLGPCGTFSDSPAKLAEQVDVLFTMLAHPDAVEQAALGADGFLNHLRPGALWVDCSSVNPTFSKMMTAECARRHYEVAFTLRWMQKDSHLATVSAYETGVAMPLTNIAKEMYRLAMRDGHATEDFSAVYELVTGNDQPLPSSASRSLAGDAK